MQHSSLQESRGYVNNWMCQSREYIEDKSMHQVALASIHALTIVWTFITVCQVQFTPGWKSAEWTQRCVNLWNNLGFSLYAALFVCHIVTTLDDREKSEMRVSADWCVTVEYWKLSSIRVIFVDYQTSKLQCNHQSYIQIDSIGDVQSFSIETLTGVTLSWKTKLNRSISAIEDGILGWLQHRHKMYCKKGRLV